VSWEEEVHELKRREQLALAMGGPDKVARQHEFNKLTIRERIDSMADTRSFHEIGALAGVAQYDDEGNLTAFTPSNFVFGTAEIDGRPVILSGDDFTVRGGSADASIAGKRTQAEGLALELKLPHIRLVDGMGGGGSVKIRSCAAGKRWSATWRWLRASRWRSDPWPASAQPGWRPATTA
jgi:acetyl-CoA carboxylase carboxyltransferase component